MPRASAIACASNRTLDNLMRLLATDQRRQQHGCRLGHDQPAGGVDVGPHPIDIHLQGASVPVIAWALPAVMRTSSGSTAHSAGTRRRRAHAPAASPRASWRPPGRAERPGGRQGWSNRISLLGHRRRPAGDAELDLTDSAGSSACGKPRGRPAVGSPSESAAWPGRSSRPAKPHVRASKGELARTGVS